MRHPFRTAAAAAAFAVVLAACGGDDSEALKVCSDIPYPPFEFEDASSDLGYTGFDIELIAAVADKLGRDVEIVVAGFDALTSGTAMAAGQCDLAISAMTITVERLEQIDFSEPYYSADQSLLVPNGSSIASIADLVAPLTVGVQSGTTGESYAQANVTGATVRSFENGGDLLTALAAGQLDAVIQDLPVNVEEAQKGAATVVETYPTEEFYGIAFAKGSELVAPVNEALAELRADGTYDELFERWFPTGN